MSWYYSFPPLIEICASIFRRFTSDFLVTDCFDHVKILHKARQWYCRALCRISTWQDHQYEQQTRFPRLDSLWPLSPRCCAHVPHNGLEIYISAFPGLTSGFLVTGSVDACGRQAIVSNICGDQEDCCMIGRGGNGKCGRDLCDSLYLTHLSMDGESFISVEWPCNL